MREHVHSAEARIELSEQQWRWLVREEIGNWSMDAPRRRLLAQRAPAQGRAPSLQLAGAAATFLLALGLLSMQSDGFAPVLRLGYGLAGLVAGAPAPAPAVSTGSQGSPRVLAPADPRQPAAAVRPHSPLSGAGSGAVAAGRRAPAAASSAPRPQGSGVPSAAGSGNPVTLPPVRVPPVSLPSPRVLPSPLP